MPVGHSVLKSRAAGKPGFCPYCGRALVGRQTTRCSRKPCARAYQREYHADMRHPALLSRVISRDDDGWTLECGHRVAPGSRESKRRRCTICFPPLRGGV